MRFYDPSSNPPERLDSEDLFPKVEPEVGATRCLNLGMHPSVTTVLDVLKEDYLEKWHCKRAIEVDRELGSNLKPNEVVKEYFSRPSENADFGTTVHDMISDYAIKGTKGTGREWEHAMPLIRWLDENVEKFLISEETLASETLGVAGTVDLVFRTKDGRNILGDMKVVKWSAKYPSTPGLGYKLQLSAYQDMLRTERALDVERMSLFLASPFGWNKQPKLIRYEYQKCYLDDFKAARRLWETHLRGKTETLITNGVHPFNQKIALPL
jgi:hypothetical protein